MAGLIEHGHVIEPRFVDAVSRCAAPGPDMAMQTPSLPLNFAQALAMNAAISF